MSKTKKFWMLTVVVFTVVITTAIIGIKKYIPESKAEEKNAKTIQVTYKAGIGTGEDVTVNQTVCDSQTQGTNDYTDGKIVLYRNGKNGVNFSAEQVEYNNVMYDRILTGWKLTSVMKNGEEITNFIEPENQNYADKTNANKDIGTVYAQEGWYIVPDGVTGITVEAVYARAIYIRSPFDKMYYDEFHVFYYGENSDGTTTLNGNAVAKSSDDNDGSTTDKAVSTLRRAYELVPKSDTQTMYDTAFVLCGDMYEINYNPNGSKYATGVAGTYTNYSYYHFGGNESQLKPVTITSANNSYYNLYTIAISWDFYNQSSLRLDNLVCALLPMNNIKKVHTEVDIKIDTYVRSRQFNFMNENIEYETTETVKTNSEKITIRYENMKKAKLNGGGWSAVQSHNVKTATLNKSNYIYIGGTAEIAIMAIGEFNNDSTNEMFLTNPISLVVTGGNITQGIYGTAYVQGGSVKGNVNIFISGGKIAKIYGGGNGSVYPNGDENGDVNIEITGGIFGSIFGGGQYYTSKISGDVNINIENAKINENFFGGGRGGQILGNINLNLKNVIIRGNFFGGGFGLTDGITYITVNQTSSQEFEQNKKEYNKKAISVGDVNWEEAPKGFPQYNEKTSEVEGRKYHSYRIENANKYFLGYGVKYSLTLANIGKDININIENSTVEQNIYGGASIGLVEGNINLDVKNTNVTGNIYGGGDGKTTPSTIALYAPIQDYKELTSPGEDSNQKIGDFSWTNDKDILTYFKGIYDGKNKVIYNADNTTTAFSELSAEAQAVAEKYGAKQLAYSSDVDKLGQVEGDITINIDGGTYKSDIYGGGNAGITKGNTNVTIGQENSNANISVTGLVYGGGRGDDANNDGDASDFTTVYGNSKVLIQGVNTSVENYGSTKLGAVAGNVDVNFKNYWSGNSTAKYQKMNGIDRATTVSFENSYVLLENKDASGNLVGIQSIENLRIPKGSGLKISANGEITGNFEGGGELYLDSLVCLTVGGNITGQTTMVLNPELMESGTQLIRGGIKAPYLKVKGTAPEVEQIALVSGEPNKYKIMQASKEAVKEVTGEDYIYYYIAEDIIIENDITVSSNSIAGRSYKNPITNTEDQYILNNGIFSTDVGVDYYLTNSAYKSKDYTNITRKLKLISNSNNSKTVKFPEGTEVLMIVKNEYYYYIVGENATNEISLSDFKKSDETSAKYNELKDITNSDLVTKTYNEIKGTTSYTFKENYKFIFSFENTEGIEEDTYYPSIEVYYSGISFGDAKKDVANNIVNIQKREYSAELSKDREYYESNGIINLSGNITVSEVNAKTVLPADVLNLRLKLQNSNDKEIAIPQGTQIKLNNQEGKIQDGQAIVKLLDNIGTSGRTENINMTIDMTGVLPQNRLPKDNYTIKLEYQDNKKYKELTEILANIIDEQNQYGVNAKVNQMEGIAEDKIQLIEQGQEIRRSIKVVGRNSSELKNMKLKIKAEEKTGEFEYRETANSKKINIGTTEIDMIEQNLEQDVNITFSEKVQSGIYKIIFELYDEYGTIRTQDYVNFIVSE